MQITRKGHPRSIRKVRYYYQPHDIIKIGKLTFRTVGTHSKGASLQLKLLNNLFTNSKLIHLKFNVSPKKISNCFKQNSLKFKYVVTGYTNRSLRKLGLKGYYLDTEGIISSSGKPYVNRNTISMLGDIEKIPKVVRKYFIQRKHNEVMILKTTLCILT